MSLIKLEFFEIKVTKYLPLQNSVEFCIQFDDGTKKEMYKIIQIKNPEKDTEEIIEEVKKVALNSYRRFEGGYIKEIKANFMITKETETRARLTKFVRDTGILIETIKNKKSSDGYIELIKKINSMKINF